MTEISDMQRGEGGGADEEEEEEILEPGQGGIEKERRKRWVLGFLGRRRNRDCIFCSRV